MSAPIDFASIMAPVAIQILGEPNQTLSSKTELRWGTRGSFAVDVIKGTWCDHEDGDRGGGVLDLLRVKLRLDKTAAMKWLCDNQFIPAPKVRQQIVDTYDYTDPQRALRFQVVRYEPKDFRQRRPNGNGGWIWDMKGIQRVPYHLPEVIAAVANKDTIFIAEGEKGVAALKSLGLVATCSPGGAGKWRQEYSSWFTNADIVLLPDNDDPGRDHVVMVGNHLTDIAARLRVLALPGLAYRADVADWVANGGTAAALAELAANAPSILTTPPPPTGWRPIAPQEVFEPGRHFRMNQTTGVSEVYEPPGTTPPPEPTPSPIRGPTPIPRPTIRCATGKVDVLADAAEQALLQAGADIFQRADRLVRPGQAEVSAADGRTTIAAGLYEINDAALIEELTRVAIWEKYNARSKSFVQCDPPPLVANVLAARKGRWGLRSVAGVLTCPTLRPDGSILSKPGYDPDTRLYYMPDHTLRMPAILERPSKQDAEHSLEIINELLIDFQFVGKVDRAVALSLIISSIVRGALHMVPLHAFTAPTPGSGKSYLADITTAIVSGRYCPVITPGRSEEELEKRLGSMLLSGCPTISLDNISSELTGDALCQVTERPTIRIRILGKSETPECEFRGIVIANGNNLVVAGDMTRRVIIGKLDTGLERPEGREFNSDPVRMVLADRGKYIAAALTIVRAYIAADKPDKLIPLASYAAWSDLVRSSLIWLGNADPVISMQEARDNDPVVSTLRAALEAWRAAFGDVAKTTSEVAAKLFGFDPDTPEGKTLLNLREALVPVASVRNVIDATKLSYWLRKSKGRPVGDLKFTGVPGHGGVIAWKVIKAPGASK